MHKVYARGEGLFDNLFTWIQLFIDIFRDGLGDPLSLEVLLPHSGLEREKIIKEIDAIALYHYKMKLAHETKVRRKFVRSQGEGKSDADAEDEAAALLVNGIVDELSLGELAQGQAEELDAEFTSSSEESDSDDSEDEDDTDSDDYETASGNDSAESSRTQEDRPPIPPPKPISRASTLPASPLSSPSQVALSRDGAHRHPGHHHHHHHDPQNQDRRGRDEARASPKEGQSGLQRLRSRSRSISALKSMFTSKSASDAPPVPPLPPNQDQLPYTPRTPTMTTTPASPSSPASSHSQALSPQVRARAQSTLQSPSPLSARSSQESQRRRPIRASPASGTSKKRKPKSAFDLKQPELQEIPNLLPLFIELVSDNFLEESRRLNFST